MKIITENKSARFEYFIEDRIEAGISLDGGEVKSIKAGNISLNDSYCSIYQGSVFIKNMHVAIYENAGAYNVKEAKRERRLLLHRREINKLSQKVKEKGYTLVPLKVYLSGSLIKLEIGLCKGKHTYDKREAIQNRDVERATAREIKKYI